MKRRNQWNYIYIFVFSDGCFCYLNPSLLSTECTECIYRIGYCCFVPTMINLCFIFHFISLATEGSFGVHFNRHNTCINAVRVEMRAADDGECCCCSWNWWCSICGYSHTPQIQTRKSIMGICGAVNWCAF